MKTLAWIGTVIAMLMLAFGCGGFIWGAWICGSLTIRSLMLGDFFAVMGVFGTLMVVAFAGGCVWLATVIIDANDRYQKAPPKTS